MFYLDSNLKLSFNLLSFESIGKIIKCFVCEESTEDLNEVENALYLEIKQFNEGKKENRKQAALKRWQKIKEEKQEKTQKEQKEDLPKRDLPIQQTNFKKSIYNNYKQLPSQNTQQTQKEKDFIKEYQSRGVLKL